MATVESVLNIARAELGYVAKNDPLAGSKYGRELAAVTGNSDWAGDSYAVPWCALFVSWVLYRAGQSCPGAPSWACADFLNAGGAAGRTVEYSAMKPGDIVIFDWHDGGVSTDHIGFVETLGSGSFVCIEGNTDGGKVARRTRYPGNIQGIVRPAYSGTSGSGTTGGGTTEGDPRYTWSQHNVWGQEELARDRMRLYGWNSAAADGICGVDTQTDIIAVWQQSLNDDFPEPPTLEVDGWLGPVTRMCIDYHPIYAGVSGNQALMAKYALWFNGHDVDLSNWDFTAADQAAARTHAQYYSGIRTDGVIDGAVVATLLPLANVN